MKSQKKQPKSNWLNQKHSPLKEKEDYAFLQTFSDLNDEQKKEFIREAFDVWKTLKTIADLIAPFAKIFLSDPRLKQAFQLLYSVIKDKSVKFANLEIKANQNRKYQQGVHQMISDLDFYFSEVGIPIRDVPKDKLRKLIANAKRKREDSKDEADN